MHHNEKKSNVVRCSALFIWVIRSFSSMSTTKNHFTTIQSLLVTFSRATASESLAHYSRYQNFFLSCLPEQWRSRVMVGEIQNGRWAIFVQHGSEAYQLRYLLPEITAALKQKLPYVPQIKIKTQPDLWLMFPKKRRTITPFKKNLSEIEAAEIINQFIQKTQNKLQQISTAPSNDDI